MANVFIYGGLAILLIGTLFGLFVAIKGLSESKSGSKGKAVSLMIFNPSPVSPEMRRLFKIWAWLMVCGLVAVGIGLAIGTK